MQTMLPGAIASFESLCFIQFRQAHAKLQKLLHHGIIYKQT